MSRLARDKRGSTLAIVVASLIPLIAMIGSGIEMSRIYMAKTRMQSACDAASLAARRVMTNDTLNPAVTDEAVKFFRFNFPAGIYDTANFAPVVTRPSSGTVRVTAATTIPSAIMYIFGHNSFLLEVSCEASQNFVNTDVMLVLDTTGSMKCLTTESSCDSSLSAPERAGSKILAIRKAVVALYDELSPIQQTLEASGMRLRYGIVPYSSAVNVGKILYDENPNYLVDSGTYQSREVQVVDWSGRNDGDCERLGGSYSNGQKTCTLWRYKPMTFDVSQFKKGGLVDTPTRLDSGKSRWDGCIEERQTVSTITASSGYAIPAGATDLNIDLVPNSNATRWKPHWKDVVYLRNSTAESYSGQSVLDYQNSGIEACPSASVKLKAFTRGEMQSFVAGMIAHGGTYHDIGMIWGTRLISDAGIFGDENPNMFNGQPVAKHIIFMTDGELAPNALSYGAYGPEYLDQRVTGASNAPRHLERHRQRFKMICNAAKGKNISIWVVAFAVNVDAALAECASNPSQISTSDNADELIQNFRLIGRNIGALRLTQ